MTWTKGARHYDITPGGTLAGVPTGHACIGREWGELSAASSRARMDSDTRWGTLQTAKLDEN